MAQFPTTVWDGNSPTRDNQRDLKSPDGLDWATLTAELQATQQQVKVLEALLGGAELLDPIALTLANSWTNKTDFGAAKYRRQGSIVQLQGAIVPGTLTDGTTVFTLPVGSRPTTPLTFPVTPSGDDDGDANMRILIGTDGTAKVYGLTNTESIDLTSIRFSIDQ